MNPDLGFFRRLSLAFAAFFAILFRREFARDVARLREGPLSLPPAPTPPEAAAPREAAPDHRAALHILSILQRDGRLIDFLEEEIADFSDAEVGAAARVVHEGCRKALNAYVSLEPVFGDREGASITIPAGFDAAKVRLTGNVVGSPPFRGSLKHHGWKATEVNLPHAPEAMDARIIAPAEVELP
jgi:hypothetical protein